MNDYYNFENLECWRQAKDLTIEIYRLADSENLSQDLVIAERLRSSAISVMSYIAQGKEQGSAGGFVQHLHLAKASAAALRSSLIISRDMGYLCEGDFLDFHDKVNRISALIGGLINAVKRSQRLKESSGSPDVRSEADQEIGPGDSI